MTVPGTSRPSRLQQRQNDHPGRRWTLDHYLPQHAVPRGRPRLPQDHRAVRLAADEFGPGSQSPAPPRSCPRRASRARGRRPGRA
jgi:hypothetical protein